MPVFHPSENVYSVDAAIGLGLPLGVSAAVAGAGQRKTVVLTGDGGFALNMTELWTAVQEKLDLVVVVMNDKGHEVIRQIQDTQYGGRYSYDDLLVPDLKGVAELAGIPFWRLTRADELEKTMRAAFDVVGPALIEVDVAAIGAIPPYFSYKQAS